jgi:hypothetical protein
MFNWVPENLKTEWYNSHTKGKKISPYSKYIIGESTTNEKRLLMLIYELFESIEPDSNGYERRKPEVQLDDNGKKATNVILKN